MDDGIVQRAHAIGLARIADGLPGDAETDLAQAEEEAQAGRNAMQLHQYVPEAKAEDSSLGAVYGVDVGPRHESK